MASKNKLKEIGVNSSRKSLKVSEKFNSLDKALLTWFTNIRLNQKQITGALVVQKLRKNVEN